MQKRKSNSTFASTSCTGIKAVVCVCCIIISLPQEGHHASTNDWRVTLNTQEVFFHFSTARISKFNHLFKFILLKTAEEACRKEKAMLRLETHIVNYLIIWNKLQWVITRLDWAPIWFRNCTMSHIWFIDNVHVKNTVMISFSIGPNPKVNKSKLCSQKTNDEFLGLHQKTMLLMG